MTSAFGGQRSIQLSYGTAERRGPYGVTAPGTSRSTITSQAGQIIGDHRTCLGIGLLQDSSHYSGRTFERAGEKRREEHWIAGRLAASDTRIAPVWRGQNLLNGESTAYLPAGNARRLSTLHPNPESTTKASQRRYGASEG